MMYGNSASLALILFGFLFAAQPYRRVILRNLAQSIQERCDSVNYILPVKERDGGGDRERRGLASRISFVLIHKSLITRFNKTPVAANT